MSDPTILAFDTSGPYCAAALLHRGQMSTRIDDMARGQAEHLMPMLEEVLAAAGIGWRDLDAVGVGIGPGNFTGIRISVSAARGLALGLGIPAVGISGFDVLGLADTCRALAIPAPRGQAYLMQGDGPALLVAETALPADVLTPDALTSEARIEAVAQIAATRRHDPALPRPAPLYIRPANAAPARDTGPILLP
ncbi:tRNA (adenosine(37)-N6)-threonylcarbamoyltransferase complex dimerization subunit type 1 TsaB [Loktanella sp. IMCC34160]|uniref:tRNA (adenosine(37)-N6)-threonylcarbamoyltransferase complex dimerization subunit type 1 TsaB n=1 Tax=Loktanella sp. IMCC34160 TaxID=2510646 RepID=UPI00101B9AC2|nr:tRNA (adenosine(37)-N6)-threonylcarbamoyltransferase complex dimerization subunit type 1 TsaB [Loktanella sp. IMCC34160]RYG92776.1 tRNA (adenosine(37)-N6)-threonylcarbamoyltransferase complex dimerization subunit type 1 TsaB [Loktanella sp. IMCC34160]